MKKSPFWTIFFNLPNITILEIVDAGSRKEIIAKLYYPAPKCQHCHGKIAKDDFQKPSKIPYLDCVADSVAKATVPLPGVWEIAVAETSLVKKNHQIPVILNQTIAQKLMEKVAMTTIAESWDEYSFKKGKMSVIAQDFDSLKIMTILDGRTQTTIQNHFLSYSKAVRSRVKVIAMDMFSPYYDILANHPHLPIFKLGLSSLSLDCFTPKCQKRSR